MFLLLRCPRFPLSALFALLLVFGSAGCKLVGRGKSAESSAPPDYARVEATGQADLEKFAGADPWAKVFAEGITIASDPHSADAALDDPAARMLVARASARRDALRKLATAILETKDAGGVPVSQAIAGNADTSARLNKLLEEQALIVYADDSKGIVATAKLSADLLRAAFNPASETGQPILTEAQKEQANQAAYDKALVKAKQQLKTELLAVKVKGDRTVGDALAKDSSAMNDLDARLFITQPDEVTYPVVGTCKVAIFFDKNRAIELAQRSVPWWKVWQR